MPVKSRTMSKNRLASRQKSTLGKTCDVQPMHVTGLDLLVIKARGDVPCSIHPPSISSSTMSYYTEEDPLLPRDRQAPEIHGSRPQSIKEDYIISETDQLSNDDELDVGRRNRRTFSDYMGMVLGLCVFSSLILMTIPDGIFRDIFRDRRPAPQTIEQRVNKILTDTPLIGISSPFFVSHTSNTSNTL